jgi:[ribosomal protein S5]-alanine N-acetyltransferase
MLTKTEFYERFSTVIPGESDLTDSFDISFTPLSMDGAEEMHRYSVKECFYEHLEFPPFKNFAETTQYLEKLFKRMEGEGNSQNSIYWFVRRKSDNYLIGTACLVSLDYGSQSVEWGYGIDPDFWGHGYILQLQEILKNFVFETLELNRLHGITMVTNLRTIESVKSAGMLHEGIAKDFYCKDGKFIDGWRYAITGSDYFGRKSSPEKNSIKANGNDIIALFKEILNQESIDPSSTMENTTNWDSLTHMNLMIGLKTRFGIKFTPRQIAKAKSVKAILEIIDE